MRSYRVICDTGSNIDIFTFKKMEDIKDKISEMMEVYKVVTVWENKKFICRYVYSDNYGILKQTKLKI